MAVKLPQDQKTGVPAYMVSFGDMITLLLTFFILLVALADTQAAGLVGAGRGPIIKHVNAKGQPGIMAGRMREVKQAYKSDSWWIPSQEGDPDQMQEVVQKLERELVIHFKPDEASLTYDADRISLRMPVQLQREDGEVVLDSRSREIVATIAEALRADPERRVRINGDVPRSSLFSMELLESATLGRLIYEQLNRAGVPAHRLSLWGWGSSRPLFPSAPGRLQNKGVTIEILETGTRLQGGSDGK